MSDRNISQLADACHTDAEAILFGNGRLMSPTFPRPHMTATAAARGSAAVHAGNTGAAPSMSASDPETGLDDDGSGGTAGSPPRQSLHRTGIILHTGIGLRWPFPLNNVRPMSHSRVLAVGATTAYGRPVA